MRFLRVDRNIAMILSTAAFLLVFCAPARACVGGDDCVNGLVFKQYVSAGPAADTMAVFLHGDVSSGRNGDYMLSSAQKFVKDVPGARAVVLLRPGYFDRDNRVSEGSDCGRRDCYTKQVVAIVADAMAQLKTRFGAKAVWGLGHSGGSAILANVMVSRPDLIDGAVLTSCPCDIRAWKPHWTSSLSPLDGVAGVSRTTRVIAITGRNDVNTVPLIAQRYIEALRAAGRDAKFITVDGTHDYRSVRDAGLEALSALALQ